MRKLVIGLQITILVFLGVGVGAFVGVFMSVSKTLPELASYSPPEVSKIYSADNVLLCTVGEENREFVKLDQVPRNLIDATIAIEDRRFYDHAGVDIRGIMRATWRNIVGGEMSEGGSTITQQLARNVYLTQKKTFSRKAREAVLAIMIERSYTKSRILELYLNQIYYGSSAFGVETASKIYFGKSVKNLDLAQCALIAGLPKSPSRLSPHENLQGAVARRNVVLNRMAELGYISTEERDEAKESQPRIVPLKPAKYRSLAPYFTDYVKRYIRDSYKFDDELIYRGGLRIYTTINYKMQEAAQSALTQKVEEARRKRQMNSTKGNAALVCIDPGTGYIRAMVGGVDYTQSEFNRAVQAKRQPGSAFKIFVYTAAVDKLGWNGSHRIAGGRFYHRDGVGRVWSPKNYDGKYPTNITMEQAIANSVNVPAVQAAQTVGLNNVISYARLMGIKSKLEPFPAIAIGGIGGVSVLEMATAYGVLAAGGVYAKPVPVAKITDSNGALVDEYRIERRNVLPERTVKVMDAMFRAVVTKGTGRSVAGVKDACGKTGTTNRDTDVWFVGYVPGKLVTAVWAGNDDSKPLRNVVGGGAFCGPIWKNFMAKAIPVYDDAHKPKSTPAAQPEGDGRSHRQRKEPVKTEPETTSEDSSDAAPDESDEPAVQPGGETIRVRVCNESALLATRSCPGWHTETFTKGTEPTTYCNIHGSRSGSREPGASGSSDSDGGRLRLTPPPSVSTN